MILQVFQSDLTPEHKDVATKDVTFSMLSNWAQSAIIVVKEAVYIGDAGDTKNIFPYK